MATAKGKTPKRAERPPYVPLDERQRQLTQWIKVTRTAQAVTTTVCCGCGGPIGGDRDRLYYCPTCTVESGQQALLILEEATNERTNYAEQRRGIIESGFEFLYSGPDAAGKN